MAESWTSLELVRAGWTEADLEWQQHAEAAMEALAAGRGEAVGEHAGAALRIARAEFASTDPRLGASLATHAACLAAARRPDLAVQLLGEAARVWWSCDSWVAQMSAPRVARSSLFHMRMEQRHRRTYEERWRAKWQDLVDEARARIAAPGPPGLIASDEAAAQLARWRRERPAMLNDTRKLLAATLFMACATR